MQNLKVKRIHELISVLNEASKAYYEENREIMTNYKFDALFDELKALEVETNVILSNSPTQTVGYEVLSKLEKSTHKTPLLSLDKTKDVHRFNSFRDGRECLLMYKLDGLTVELNYEDGELVLAKTRGNGTVGDVVTSCAKVFSNVPLAIPYRETLRISGEAFITYENFNEINKSLIDEDKYKNPRNLASGSIRQLNSEICAERNVTFHPFNILEGLEEDDSKHECFMKLEGFGFERCPYYLIATSDTNLEEITKHVEETENNIPIDGLVLTYDSRSYSESLGHTSHHMRSGLALKFKDDSVETTLKDIELDVGKSGQLSYTAIFDAVDIDGATITRATLHNFDYITDLQLGIGDSIEVIKANSVIPQVVKNNTRSNTYKKATHCPICGCELDHKGVHQFCVNYNCERQVVGRLTHWCSRDAMDIESMSEETIKAIRGNVVLNTVNDLYSLFNFKEDLLKIDRFGERKVEKMLLAIENSKTKPLNNVLYGLAIPQLGRKASKIMAEHFKHIDSIMTDSFTKQELQAIIGESVGNSVWSNLITDGNMFNVTSALFKNGLTMTQEIEEKSDVLDGLIFVVTGKVTQFANRKDLQAHIESLGGKISGGVSKNTNYLVNNDVTSTKGKNKKAKDLGIPIISGDDLLELIKERG